MGQSLHAAGFRLDEWKQTILYGLPSSEQVAPPAGITVEPVTPDTIEAAAEVAAEGNGWHPGWRERAKDGIRQRLGRQGFTLFLARLAGQPAGVGELSRSHASPRWCGLGGGAVIPRFRNQGVHTALLRHRLHAASQTGCELVLSGADFDTPSFRNQQRLGLRLAYIEATWKRAGSQ